MNETFTDNPATGKFELNVDGAIAFADYRIADKTLYIDYVEAPPALRGTGAAGRLMQHIYAYAITENLKIVPICGYAASWLRRHASETS